MQVPGINGMNHHIDTMIQASINKELIVYGVRFWGFQALRRFQWKMEKICEWEFNLSKMAWVFVHHNINIKAMFMCGTYHT